MRQLLALALAALLPACAQEVASCPQFVIPKNLFSLTVGTLNAMEGDAPKSCAAVLVEVRGLQAIYADEACQAALGPAGFLRLDQTDNLALPTKSLSKSEADRIKGDPRTQVPGLQEEIRGSVGDDAEPVALPLSGGAAVIALPVKKKADEPSGQQSTEAKPARQSRPVQTAQVAKDSCG
jgi:hypothetical protein